MNKRLLSWRLRIGRLTGKPAPPLWGPGALNLSTGAAYALLGAMPMAMITGHKGILRHKQPDSSRA
jgi:acetolactate synthase-1/2/3 large subunit